MTDTLQSGAESAPTDAELLKLAAEQDYAEEDPKCVLRLMRATIALARRATAPHADPASDGWKKLSENTVILGGLLDVVLQNGVTLYAQEYSRIDWTYVADWRYSAAQPAETTPGVVTDAQISAGAEVLCDCPKPKRIGRSAAISVFDAMSSAQPVEAAGSAVPEGFALVPLYPNTEMLRVLADDEWRWEDLLAAAAAITEDQYNSIATYPAEPVGSALVAKADWVSDMVRDIAELPDRDSPVGQPDMMLVSVNELHDIITRHAPTGALVASKDEQTEFPHDFRKWDLKREDYVAPPFAAPASLVHFDDAAIEQAALKHVATEFHMIAHLIPNYRCTEQFARLKAFAAELASGFREGRNAQPESSDSLATQPTGNAEQGERDA